MPSIPNVEYKNSQRDDGGPWAALHMIGSEGEPVDSVEEAVCVQVFYTDQGSPDELPDGDDSWIAIMEVCSDHIAIFPVGQQYGLPSYGQPIFDHVRRIMIGRYSDLALPSTIEELDGLLEGLPNGFYKNWRHGLGVLWKYRVIVSAIEAAEPVHTVLFHGPIRGGQRRDLLSPHVYAVSMGTYDELMRSVRGITSRHQRAARKEKLALCHNALMHRAQPDRYPRQKVQLAPDTLSELTNISRGAIQLTKRDQRAAVTLVRRNAQELAKAEPAEMLRLKCDIEVVSLLQLIEKCQSLISSSAPERMWQGFFKSNPFVLTMAFHFPVFLISDQPYVGGKSFHGTDGKYGDFLVSAASTGSLALIEIKNPATKLVGKPYRQGVYPASQDLSGAVAQVLVQRDTFKESFIFVGKELSHAGHSAHALTCLVIAGTTPELQEEKEAFERYRHSLHGVIVVTFDELLERLRSLYSLMTAKPETSVAPVGPWRPPAEFESDVE
jgi:hypothetical protein